MGDTLKPSLDPGLYIMTWQNPNHDDEGIYESIMGFGDLDWCAQGAMQIRWLTETIAQNRIIRVRQQYSFWDGHSRMSKGDGNKILTRSLDGKIILELKNRNKPVCPKCKVNVLSYGPLCSSCHQAKLDQIAMCKTKLCNDGKHGQCRGERNLPLTGEPCACECHNLKTSTFKEALKDWLS